MEKNERRKWTEKELNLLRELVAKITPYEEIGKILGRSGCAVRTAVHRNNIQSDHPNSCHHKGLYQEYEWCYDRYINKKMTYQQMAGELGVSKRVIEKWCGGKHKLNRLTLKNHLKLNDLQKRLILASLLGDGYIENKQPIFRVLHAENQKDYLYWKYKILKNLCDSEPRMIDKNNINWQRQFRFNTVSVNELKELKAMSIIDIIKQLDEFQLSIYLLDDGHRSKGNWQLSFSSMSLEEKEELINTCKDKFDLNGKIVSTGAYIFFDVKSSKKIDEIILKNIPNELDVVQYKVINKKRVRNNQ